MPLYSNWNGKVVDEKEIFISPNNRSFRYGDGCFETIKIIDGKIILLDLHFERLFSSLSTLQFSFPDFFNQEYLKSQILELVHVNNHQKLARVRLVVYRGDGGLYDLEDKNANFIIQSTTGNPSSQYYNEIGLHVDIYNEAKKSTDVFASIKSNNYLGYAMAAMWAMKHGLDDCILTNTFERIADASIANVFLVTDRFIKTPSLSEGCVSGVMRKYLLGRMLDEGLPIDETQITREDLLHASEVFLTNATYGIRWVQHVGGVHYTNVTSSMLYKKIIEPLFHS
jgi:branched-subunit amino acid aminotransferase/4-amino-4-deoxychorismate lyase